MSIERLTISYPDFVLNTVIEPDQIDINNLEIVTRVNENIDQENINTDKLALQDINIANTMVSVATANTIANSADVKADSAIVTADNASTKSDNAVTTANSASTSASASITISIDAKNKATQVETDYNLVKPILLQAVEDVASKVDKAYVDEVANNYTLGIINPKGIVTSMLSDEIVLSISEKAKSTDLIALSDSVASQLANLSSDAVDISVSDTGGYFTSTNAEGSLQEIGLVLNAMRGGLIETTNAILGM